jgi:hypothetical protein
MKRLFCSACILFALLCGPAGLRADASDTNLQHPFSSWDPFTFKIDDTKCRIGIAAVKLSVSELTPKDGNLVATYTIIVPLKQSENDTGLIVLPIDLTVDQLHEHGGVLRGKAHSLQKGKASNTIICEIGPNHTKSIQLEIITRKRTLKFQSRYTVIESNDES